MSTSRRKSVKVRPFCWDDLGLSKEQGGLLESRGLTPFMVTRVIEVVIPGLPEVLVRRDESGHIHCGLQSFYLDELRDCFEGSPSDVLEELVLGKLPEALRIRPMVVVIGLLRKILPVTGDLVVSPAWENALEALGQESTRPKWRGMAVTAWASRGYITDLNELVSLCQGDVVLTKEETRRAELDLTRVVFGSSDPWVRVLEDEIHNAVRFRCGIDFRGDRYQVHVDWMEEEIEVVRPKDAASWRVTLDQYMRGDPDAMGGLLGVLREKLAPFDRYAIEEVGLEDGLSAALLQHRARTALDLLSRPSGLQLSLLDLGILA